MARHSDSDEGISVRIRWAGFEKKREKRREKLSRYVFMKKEAKKRNCGEKEFLVVNNEVRRLFLLKYSWYVRMMVRADR